MVTTSRASFARRSGFLRPGARLGAAADPPGAVSADPLAPPTCPLRVVRGRGLGQAGRHCAGQVLGFFSGPVLQPTSSVSASSSCRGLSRRAGVLASSFCCGCFFSGAPAAPAEASAQKRTELGPAPAPHWAPAARPPRARRPRAPDSEFACSRRLKRDKQRKPP